MRLTDRIVLFFIAGNIPTVEEAALIARTEGTVKVRSVLASPLYGEKLEPAYALAGAIPDSYKTDVGTTIDLELYPGGDVTPEAEGTATTVIDGAVVEGVTVTGNGTTATFTVVGGAITAVALA